MVTPANTALFVINGKSRTVNCEIGGVLHPTDIIWTANNRNNNKYSSSTNNNNNNNNTIVSNRKDTTIINYSSDIKTKF